MYTCEGRGENWLGLRAVIMVVESLCDVEVSFGFSLDQLIWKIISWLLFFGIIFSHQTVEIMIA